MQHNNYQYRLTTCGVTVQSSSPYADSTQVITIPTGGSEAKAREVCRQLDLEYISGENDRAGFVFKARCTPKTSCFIWAGGAAA